MDLFCIDDSGQTAPSRPGMGPLVAVGGLHVPREGVRELELGLERLCEDTGFPSGEEFKWSPDSKMWMRKQLVGDDREAFFLDALGLAADAGATAILAIEDKEKRPARKDSPSAEMDVATMLLERADSHLCEVQREALTLFDRPGGDRKSEFEFLAKCIDTMRSGTAFVSFDSMCLVLTTDSKLTRLLQLADLIVACSVAYVGGEDNYSPSVFEGIKPLLRSKFGRVGSFGLKLHPDLLYVNLYRWLLDDEEFWRGGVGFQLPMKDRAYADGPLAP